MFNGGSCSSFTFDPIDTTISRIPHNSPWKLVDLIDTSFCKRMLLGQLLCTALKDTLDLNETESNSIVGIRPSRRVNGALPIPLALPFGMRTEKVLRQVLMWCDL